MITVLASSTIINSTAEGCVLIAVGLIGFSGKAIVDWALKARKAKRDAELADLIAARVSLAVAPLNERLAAGDRQFGEIKGELTAIRERQDREFGGNSGGLRQQLTEVARSTGAPVIVPEDH